MADYAFGFNPPYKLQTADVATRLHSLMQHTDDIDLAWTESAIAGSDSR
jgi:hypothetical protein